MAERTCLSSSSVTKKVVKREEHIMLIKREEIMSFLPHRDPFLFVDAVESVVPACDKVEAVKDLAGTKVIAMYRTKKDHAIFAGHFPGKPILPGVVQVEMMAQASSFIVKALKDDISNMNLEVALVSVENAKFRKFILPEMDLVIKTECVKVRGPMISSNCEIYHDGVLMSEATVMASMKI
jgi:3-hydroxyacyl-[acyl-carrier-protein] dehydratase